MWPKRITLYKLKTRDDAKYPQEKKYPSDTAVAAGLLWEHTLPEIGKPFFVMASKLSLHFRTAIVEEVKKIKEGYYIKTTNSEYNIIIEKE